MILKPKFFPQTSHIRIASDGLPVLVTVDGVILSVFEGPIIDLEAPERAAKTNSLERLLGNLPEGFIFRVLQRAESETQIGFENFRAEAIGQLGFVKRRVLVSFERQAERKTRGGGGDVESFACALPHEELRALGFRALESDELLRERSAPLSEVSLKMGVLDFGGEIKGVIRIYKPGTHSIDDSTLADRLDELPVPFEISVSAKKVSRKRADFTLRSQLARNQLIQDSMTGAKQEAAEKALAETTLHGASLFELEWICTLSRLDEATLRKDLGKAQAILGTFGEAMIETVGCVPSYIAARIGARQHHTFLEEDAATVCYLPMFSYGESGSLKAPQRALLLHRLDGSLHTYDQFSRRFLAFNAIICGKTGSGKSVLANALSSALMQDEDVRMIKIDVGGSYKKECEALGGREVGFNLDSPSGVNPFALLSGSSPSNEAIEVLSEFLCVLIREEGEEQIPKALRAKVEDNLKQYVKCLSEADQASPPNIDRFLEFAQDFPRRDLAARWAMDGVFANALREDPTGAKLAQTTPRYRYFNFANIQAAASRDYAEGVMAAIIAMVNLEMLRLGDRSKGQEGARLVLFCDETKFFIERFSQFFLLTAANFRKFGHGLVLMLQNIKDAEIRRPDGAVDTGIILNSPIRFFFPSETDGDYLRKQFQFDALCLRVVVSHPYLGREYREAVLQDDTGTKVIRLYLTNEEYWRMTSTKEDLDKFYKLRGAVPELTIQEAIQCLAIGSGRF